MRLTASAGIRSEIPSGLHLTGIPGKLGGIFWALSCSPYMEAAVDIIAIFRNWYNRKMARCVLQQAGVSADMRVLTCSGSQVSRFADRTFDRCTPMDLENSDRRITTLRL